jgi:cellulose biosynthesis protein BcsQ
VDLDPQGNATMGSGIDKRTLTRTVYHVLVGLATATEAIVRPPGGTYDVLGANRELAGAEVELVGLEHRERLFCLEFPGVSRSPADARCVEELELPCRLARRDPVGRP